MSRHADLEDVQTCIMYSKTCIDLQHVCAWKLESLQTNKIHTCATFKSVANSKTMKPGHSAIEVLSLLKFNTQSTNVRLIINRTCFNVSITI